jgi:hypothetical protein
MSTHGHNKETQQRFSTGIAAVIFALGLMVTAATFGACTPRSGPAQSPAPSTEFQESGQQIDDADDRSPDTAGQTPGEPAELSAPRFFVPSARLERWTPSDAVIGTLPDAVTGDQSGVLQIVTRFFGGIHAPQTVTRYVKPEQRSLVGRMFTEDMPSGVTVHEVRVGAVRWLSTDEVTLPVRLLTKTATTDGRIVLVNRSDSWYISDVLMDLRELQRPTDQRVRQLEPWADRSPLVGP